MRETVQKIPLTTVAALALLDDLASGAVHREKGFTESERIFLQPHLEREMARSHLLPVPVCNLQ